MVGWLLCGDWQSIGEIKGWETLNGKFTALQHLFLDRANSDLNPGLSSVSILSLLMIYFHMFCFNFSALYVVDLKKFRKVAAGDRLRGQYQGLSQDPNSLSNLDQVSLTSIKIF